LSITDNPVAVKPKIFAIDDDQPFLLSLAALAKSMGLSCQTFGSGEEFFQQFDPTHPGCLVLETHLPGMSGLAIQERLAREPIAPPVIFVAEYADLAMALRAMKLGAINFLLKQAFGETELWESIHSAIARDAENRRAYERRELARANLARLAESERQVLVLVLCGQSNQQIAESLGVNRRAVESRRARLMRKLGARTLPDLVRFAIEAGLFDLPELKPE
jgi:two-component system response regulator FixJ